MAEVMVQTRRHELAAQAEADSRRRSLLEGVSPETRARVMKTIPGWPTLGEAAAMLGIPETGMSPTSRRGAEGHVPGAASRRERSSTWRAGAVAAELVRYAAKHAPEAAAEVHNQVDRAMASTAPRPHVSPDSFLAVARWYLPPDLCRSVVAAVRGRVSQERLRTSAAEGRESQGGGMTARPRA